MDFRVPGIGDFRLPVFLAMLMGCATDLSGMLSQRHELNVLSLTKGGFHRMPKRIVEYVGCRPRRCGL